MMILKHSIAVIFIVLATGCATPRSIYLEDVNTGEIFGPIPTGPKEQIRIFGTLFKVGSPSQARLEVQEKLHKPVPEMNFKDLPIRQVYAIMERASGVHFILDFSDPVQPDGSIDPKKMTFSGRYISTWAVLVTLTSVADMQYRIEDNCVRITRDVDEQTTGVKETQQKK